MDLDREEFGRLRKLKEFVFPSVVAKSGGDTLRRLLPSAMLDVVVYSPVDTLLMRLLKLIIKPIESYEFVISNNGKINLLLMDSMTD